MNYRNAFSTLVALALLLCVAPAARADDAKPAGFIKQLMGRAPGKGKTAACFSRVYDGAHLANHPQQNVRAMLAMVLIDSANPDSYDLRIGSHFRGRKALFDTEGECAAGRMSRRGPAALSARIAASPAMAAASKSRSRTTARSM